MAGNPNAPFDRVERGYDPQQVATFAANALSWKRDLAAAKAELARYAHVIGSIEAVEREAAEIIEDAQRTAAGILAMAADPSPAETTELDEREQRVSAAAANLWKRRGVLTQPE